MTKQHVGDCSSECAACAWRCASNHHLGCSGTEKQRADADYAIEAAKIARTEGDAIFGKLKR